MIQHKKYTMMVLQHYVNSITFLLNIILYAIIVGMEA